jgi:predicted amidohydrolase YtcJ
MSRKLLASIFLLILISCAKQRNSNAADTVILNAKVYTLSWDDPSLEGIPAENAPFDNNRWSFDAEAIALKDQKILAVGTNEEIKTYQKNHTKTIDANGAVVIPGLIESHGHLQEIGEKKAAINLEGLSSQEILDIVINRSKEVPEGEWIIASGWDEAEFANQYPDMKWLSQQTPKHPIVLVGLRGFGVMGNQLAFEKAGITQQTPATDGGEILKDANGDLKFVLLNSAKKLLLDKVPQKTLEQEVRMMHYGFQELLKLGFTTTHNLGVDTNDMNVYEYLHEKDSLPMRVHAFVAARMYNIDLVNKWIEKGPMKEDDSFLQVRGFKGYYDGSLGSRGAEFLEEYSDKKGHTGVGGEAYGFYDSLMIKALDKDFQLAIHAIGDKANRDVLNLFENYFQKNPKSRELRHRIEHAQVVHPDDFPRFDQLNIIASMEPAHAVEDMPWAVLRIGIERVLGAYAWRTLRKNNTKVIFNSDFTGSDPSFFYGMYCAITKRKKGGGTAYYPEQAFTKEETLRAYTIWGAYASHQENLTGTIEVGKWADLTFLDTDILNASPDEILQGQVLKTMINGTIAFEK